MSQRRFFRVAPVAGLLFGAAACATMKPPVLNSGPVLSKEGVQVAVLRQTCAKTEPVDEGPIGSVDETIEVEVRNGSPDPVTIHPDRFRLFGADGATPAAISAGSGEARTLLMGDAQTFALQFMAREGLECTKEMRLDPNTAITLHDSPVGLQPVPFRPL